MNIFNILNSLEKIDGDVYERMDHATRRHFLHKVSSKVAAVSGTAIFTSLLTKTYARTADAGSVLNFALLLEYLEDEFYKKGNAVADTLMSGGFAKYKPTFAQIGKHETAHVTLLEGALKAAGVTLVTKPDFDFSAGGAYSPFTKFDDFVFLSHAFEDTGVRAYKGQAGNLMGTENKAYLEVALQIHSVEARHAAISRKVLSEIRMNPAIKSWITNAEGSPAPVYAGDDVLTQAGVNLLDFTDVDIPADKLVKAATEAFDEPLDRPAVEAIAGLFI